MSDGNNVYYGNNYGASSAGTANYSIVGTGSVHAP